METYNPDTLQRLAIQQSSEFGRWYDEDYFPSHEEISYAMSLGMPLCLSVGRAVNKSISYNVWMQCSIDDRIDIFLISRNKRHPA